MTPVLELSGVSKTFSGRRVLCDVDLSLNAGEVHGLLGQNGSGKSTLIKILAGYHAPDAGAALHVGGEPVALPLSPDAPRRLGIAFVHQDLGLVDSASVVENMRLGRYRTGLGWRVSWRAERRRASAALAEFGLRVDPDRLVGELQQVDKAMLAILRALEELRDRPHGVLVLDEPTAYLPRDAVERLTGAIEDSAARGIGVLLVSHRLEEIRAVTQRVSILKDGALVACEPTAGLDEQELIRKILGFTLDRLYPEPHHPRTPLALSVRDARGPAVRDVSFDLHEGEVLGLTGLMGMGYEEVPYLLFGAQPAQAGTLACGEASHDLPRLSPRRAIDAGLALLPAHRLRDGAVADATLVENVTLPTIGAHMRGGALRHRRETAHVHELLERFRVRPPEPCSPLGTLSGGNQQKALVAKWFETRPRVFMMHEPTQGVDVGAKREIFQQIRDAAEQGTSFLLASAEYADLAALCDRVIVFRHGQPVAELTAEAVTQERIVTLAYADGAASAA